MTGTSSVHPKSGALRGLGRAAAALALMCVGAAGGAVPAAAQISATPVVIRLDASDSAQVTSVQVRNDGDRQVQVRFYAHDFEQVDGGGYEFREFGSTAGSCGSRLSVTPSDAVLMAGEQQRVQVRLAPGAGACWAMLFVESAPQGTGPFRVVERIGVRLMNVPAGLTRDVDVASVNATVPFADSVSVRARIQNTGNAAVEISGRVEIRDMSGAVLRTVDFGPMGLFPGVTREVDVMVPVALAPGRYLAVPIVDFGGDFLAGGQATFTVPNR